MLELGLAILLATAGLVWFVRRRRNADQLRASAASNPKNSVITANIDAKVDALEGTGIKPTRAQRGRSSQQLKARRDRPTGHVLHESEKVLLDTDDLTISVDMSRRELPFPNMDGPAYRIGYIDRDGVVTEREIIIQWVNANDTSVWTTAFCHLRGAVRSFKADRIVSMVDTKTGDEITNPARHLQWLSKHM